MRLFAFVFAPFLIVSCEDKAVVAEIERSRDLQQSALEQQERAFEQEQVIMEEQRNFYDALSAKQTQLIEAQKNRFEEELARQAEANANLSKVESHLNTLTGNEQWEYLIVSYGKTSFSSVPESVKNGSSKLTAFREFSHLLYGSEALSTQEKLDILGRLDWELVSVVGAIGGDQQFVFKRPRNVNRAEIELEVASELKATLEAEKELKDKAAEIYRKIQEERAQASLVDLDAVEKSQAMRAAEVKGAEFVRQQLIESGIKLNGTVETELGEVVVKKVDIETSVSYDLKSYRDVTAKIEIDGSEALIKNNREYRKSQAEIIARSLLDNVKNTLRAKGLTPIKYPSIEGGNYSCYIFINAANDSDRKIVGSASFYEKYELKP